MVGLLVLLATVSGVFAGVDPQDPGLPQGWTQTLTAGYKNIVIGDATGLLPNGNQGRLNRVNTWSSALCVECHTVNPSAHTAAPATMPSGDNETMHRGSHFVRNYLDGAYYATNQAVAATVEKIDAWDTAGNNGDGLSRYGAAGGTASSTGSIGEMICESCHNALVNNGQNLLLGSYDEAKGDAGLCEACHAAQARAQSIQSDPSPDHHPTSGNFVGGDTGASPCDTGLHLLNPDNTTRLNLRPTDETGGVGFATDTSPVKEMSCASCHTPHDALTATGARVLRRGASKSTDSAIKDKSCNVAYVTGTPAGGVKGVVLVRKPTGAVATGLHRQLDMEDGDRLVSNYDPLCQSCH
jgi:hypothetical protein